MSTSENTGATAEVGIQCKYLSMNDVSIQCGSLSAVDSGTKYTYIKCKILPMVDVGVQCDISNSSTTESQPIQDQPNKSTQGNELTAATSHNSEEPPNCNTDEVAEDNECCVDCLYITLRGSDCSIM